MHQHFHPVLPLKMICLWRMVVKWILVSEIAGQQRLTLTRKAVMLIGNQTKFRNKYHIATVLLARILEFGNFLFSVYRCLWSKQVLWEALELWTKMYWMEPIPPPQSYFWNEKRNPVQTTLLRYNLKPCSYVDNIIVIKFGSELSNFSDLIFLF